MYGSTKSLNNIKERFPDLAALYDLATQVSATKENVASLAGCRVSSKEQGTVQHGSLEQQLRSIMTKVVESSRRSEKNYHISEIFEEEESGKWENTKNRKFIQRVEVVVPSGEIGAIFVDRGDRFSRDLEYNIRFARMMIQHKAEYHEVENGWIDFNQQDQFFGFVYRSFNAEAYSTNLSKNVRTQGRRARVNNGKDSSTAPVFGLDAHPTLTCQYVINVAEAALLNKLGWYLVKTRDFKAAAKYGNELGITTKVRWTKEGVNKYGERLPSKKVGGQPLNAKRVSRLFSSPKIRGEGKFLDDLNQFPEKQDADGYVDFKYSHECVLDPMLVIELDKLSYENKIGSKTYSGEYLLSGIMYTEDGASYRGESSLKIRKTKTVKYTYYLAKTEIKSIKRLNADLLESSILYKLEEYLQGSDAFKKLLVSRKEIHRALIQKYESEISTKKQLLETRLAERDKFSSKMRQLVLSESGDLHEMLLIMKDEKSIIENELLTLKDEIILLDRNLSEVCHIMSDKEFLERLRIFFKNFENLSKCDKKILLRAFIQKIVVHSNSQIELRINSFFEGDFKEELNGGSEKSRVNLKWLGRWDSNPRPID